MSEPNTADLIRELAESERRYAELAAFVKRAGLDAGMALLATHASEVGMSKWHDKFFATQQPAKQEPSA